jgi:malate synthase
VAHPDLVATAQAQFDAVLGGRPNQLERLRDDVSVSEGQLVDFTVPGGEITDAGLRVNVSVGVRYIDAWLRGVGAAAIDNLMEDAATAEISRAQVWSWVQAGRFDEERVRGEIAAVEASDEARALFADVALSVPFKDFLTTTAYDRLP